MCCDKELANLAVEALEEGSTEHFFRYADEMSYHCGQTEVTRLLATAGAGEAFLVHAANLKAKAERYERIAQRYISVADIPESQRLQRMVLPAQPLQAPAYAQ